MIPCFSAEEFIAKLLAPINVMAICCCKSAVNQRDRRIFGVKFT